MNCPNVVGSIVMAIDVDILVKQGELIMLVEKDCENVTSEWHPCK